MRDNDKFIYKVLESCIHEVQVFSWLSWIERLEMLEDEEYIYSTIGQIKLDELYQELENHGRDKKTKRTNNTT